MSEEPTRRELKAAIDRNGELIARNSELIAKNSEGLAEVREAVAENRAAIAENRAAIAENRAAILMNGEAIAGNRVAIERLEVKFDRQSATLTTLFEVFNDHFEKMYQKFDDFSAWAQESERTHKLLFEGQNENRYRLDGHEKRLESLESRAS